MLFLGLSSKEPEALWEIKPVPPSHYSHGCYYNQLYHVTRGQEKLRLTILKVTFFPADSQREYIKLLQSEVPYFTELFYCTQHKT